MNKKISWLSFLSVFSLVACNKSNGPFKVTFDLCNADPNVVIEVNRGNKITNKPIASKYGCNFVSYKKDGRDFDFNNTLIKEDTVIKAHYKYDENILFTNRLSPEVRHDNANLRVMTYNLLTSIYDYHPRHHGYNEKNEKYAQGIDNGRDYQAFRTIMRYLPDVIGIQECDQTTDGGMPSGDYGWYEAFIKARNNPQFNSPYVIINENNRTPVKGNTLFSTIAYNPNKVTLDVDKDGNPCWGTKLSSYSDNDNCRYLTWAKFRINNTNKHFMVTSTHWNLKSTCSPETRVKQAKESATDTLAKQKEYGDIPVITTGDYNRNETEDPYKAFMSESGFNDSKYSSDKRGFTGISYHLGEGGESAPSCYYRTKQSLLCKDADAYISIDHLFTSQNVKCNYYDMIPELDALYSSDHMPSYVDVTI